jgi:xylan 1,4-beta-xylosidase
MPITGSVAWPGRIARVHFEASGDYSYASSFPQPILMGAAFDDDLIYQVASTVSTEARVYINAERSGLDFWTPNINPFRDPRWGRGQETPGEDPFHIKSYLNSLIHGLQGDQDPDVKKVVATCKHYAGYDLEDWDNNLRDGFNAQISTQELVEYYLQPFHQYVLSNVGAFMCSYNAVNGDPSCANGYLLQTILREHWGWTQEDQWITGDCDAARDIFEYHNYAPSEVQAVADAIIAGTDLDCSTAPDGQGYYLSYLPAALQQGLFNESLLGQALTRRYSSLVKTGYFDGPDSTWRNITWDQVNTPDTQDLAYQAAWEGITLLKNDGLLPLKYTGQNIAMVENWANATVQMHGNYYGPPSFLKGPLQAAQAMGATVNFAPGPRPGEKGWINTPAVQAAQESDLVFFIGGLDTQGIPGTETTTEAEGVDRTMIGWEDLQLSFINDVAAVGKPMVLVQMGGGQIDESPITGNSNISAIMWAGYPGQDGGAAILDILFGKQAPAGRLPITQYPADYATQVPMTDMSLRPSSSNPGRTYQWYTGEPVFSCGFGLHYTTFNATVSKGPSCSYATSDLASSCGNSTVFDQCKIASLSVDIANTGSADSDFVNLAFITGSFGPEPYPNKRLVAYQRLHGVAAGSTQTAELDLTLESLARVDESGNTVLYPGDYAILIDEPTQTTFNFTLTGGPVTLDSWPQPPSS